MNSTGFLLISPLIIPLLTAIAGLFGVALRPNSRQIQRVISTVGGLVLLFSALLLFREVHLNGIQVVQVGSWPMPFGVTLVADLFSAIMVVVSGLIGFAVQLYSLASMNQQREVFGYYPLYFVLLMGVNGAFLTGDLFNLYVWFEVMLMSSFVLMALGRSRGQTAGAIKYVTLNLISSAIFLSAIGILYGLVGTLNMADLAVKFAEVRSDTSVLGLINAVAAMFLIAFGIKAAVFPLFFWLPDSYFAPHPAVSAVFAGLLTKVGVYAMIRVFTLIFPLNSGFFQVLLLWIAGLTMLTGVLGAVAQNEVRRILSFHIISQIGYMIMGLAIFTPLALAGAVFYIFHHVVVKTNLFLVAGMMERAGGTGDLTQLGSLYRRMPFLAILFLIPALSLAGLPPLSGFFAKLSLLQAGLAEDQFWLVGVALFVSLLTLYSMTKIWTLGFWKPAPEEDAQPAEQLPIVSVVPVTASPRWTAWYVPMILLALVTLTIGFGAGVFFPIAMQAGQELFDTSAYIEAVFRSAQ
jgi:multicomponent Na+:H+ antiporter subunit D